MSGSEEPRLERLRSLVDPATTAVVTVELQQGVVGPDALLPELVQRVAEAGTVEAAAVVCRAARAVGARVVHCTAEHRADGAGATENAKVMALIGKFRREQGLPTEIGTPGAALVAELGPEPVDIIIPRMHGMTPFMSTSLDQMLRNIGTRTVVVTGVSLNIGILGLCLNALDLGYQVVLVRDAVAGVPAEYADAVIDHTLSLIAAITTSAELCSLWDTVQQENRS
ncbi:MAG: cysteine hydrolase [Acidimicrobiaceae bacterium]|nr:cysteine hydrolase [Acidimicrobiaceae bacterium]MDE0606394.1 cysteine hydrolase [Acidimicrobiaceae bacterium]